MYHEVTRLAMPQKRPEGRRHDLHLKLDERLTAAVERFQKTCSPVPTVPRAVTMLMERGLASLRSTPKTKVAA
jgi:hypothetical protein